MIKTPFIIFPKKSVRESRTQYSMSFRFVGRESQHKQYYKERKHFERQFYQYFDDKVDLVEVMTRSFIDFSLKKPQRLSLALTATYL